MAPPQLQFTAKHWAALAVFLGALGARLITHGDDWTHVVTPSSVGFMLIELGAFVGVMFSNRQPESRAARDKRWAKQIAAADRTRPFH